MRRLRHTSFALLSPLLLLPVAGCHSAYVEATVQNRTASPVSLLELDYPSASFGTQSLAPGQDFKYRFKVLGSGEAKLTFTDSARKEHTAPGPPLSEGDEGPLTAIITPNGVTWTFQTTRKAR